MAGDRLSTRGGGAGGRGCRLDVFTETETPTSLTNSGLQSRLMVSQVHAVTLSHVTSRCQNANWEKSLSPAVRCRCENTGSQCCLFL